MAGPKIPLDAKPPDVVSISLVCPKKKKRIERDSKEEGLTRPQQRDKYLKLLDFRVLPSSLPKKVDEPCSIQLIGDLNKGINSDNFSLVELDIIPDNDFAQSRCIL